MFEIIFGLVPLLFVCSAIGLIILNFGAVAEYIIHVITTAFQAKSIITPVKPTQLDQYTPKQIPRTSLLQRLATTFQVIFFPNLDIAGAIKDHNIERQTKLQEKNTQSTTTHIIAKEVDKFQIKTFRADGSDSMKTYERFSAKPQVLQQVAAPVTTIPTPVTIPIKTTPVVPTVTPIPNTPAPLPIKNDINKPEKEFDAISALEARVKASLESKKPEAPQPIPTATTLNRNFAARQVSVAQQYEPIKTVTTVQEKVAQQDITTFQTEHLGSHSGNILHLISQTLITAILSLPIIFVVGSILMFLSENNFDISQIGNYPNWTREKIESFIQSTIVNNQ